MPQNRATSYLHGQLWGLLEELKGKNGSSINAAAKFDDVLDRYEGVVCMRCRQTAAWEFADRLQSQYHKHFQDRTASRYFKDPNIGSLGPCTCPPDSEIVETIAPELRKR